MPTLWQQFVQGPDSGMIDNAQTNDNTSVTYDKTLAVPDFNTVTCRIGGAGDSFDRAVMSILTPSYLPGQVGSIRGRFRFPGPLTIAGTITIVRALGFDPVAAVFRDVVNLFVDNTTNHLVWTSDAGTISNGALTNDTGFVVAANVDYWFECDWFGDEGGGGYKNMWINTNPALVGPGQTKQINVSALTGKSIPTALKELRFGIDHLNGTQITGQSIVFSRVQVADTTVIQDIGLPVASGVPTITGTPSVGSPLTGHGTGWTGSPTFTHQWYANSGSGPVAIPGATSAFYTPVNADVGKTITFTETATNASGSVTVTSVPTSAITSGATNLPATLILAPIVTGVPQIGGTLGCSTGTWSSALPITQYLYQWLASASPVDQLGVGGVPASIGTVTVGGSSAAIGGQNLEVIGPFVTPHGQVLDEGFIRLGGGSVISHTRMVVYTDSISGPFQIVDTSAPVTINANDSVAERSFLFSGTKSLAAGAAYWLGFWTDGNINLPYSPGFGSGSSDLFTTAVAYNATASAPATFPGAATGGTHGYTIYLRDSAFIQLVGQTTSSHLIDAGNVGEQIICRVIAVNSAGQSQPAYSAAIQPVVVATFPGSTLAPHIDDIPVAGVPIIGYAGNFFPAATSVTFQWLESLSEEGPFTFISVGVPFAFTSTYTPTVPGHYLRLAVIATGSGGVSPVYYSNVVGPILDLVTPTDRQSGQGPLPYLEFCGVEVANAARTLAYLQNGLADTMQGHWELSGEDLCGVLYRTGAGSCASPNVFVSPVSDPAPWYDPLDRGSAKFLGMVMLDIKGYDSTITRTITNRISGLGGGNFGQQTRIPRMWKFRAALISASGAGAEYGLRWLTHILQASCDPCTTCDLKVRLFCSPEDCSDDESGERASYDVALVDGPHEIEPWGPKRAELTTDTLAGARDYVTVEFTVAAANPFLYNRPNTHLEIDIGQTNACVDICDFLFGSASSAHCAMVEPPPRGTLGSIFTLTSDVGLSGNLLLEAHKICPDVTNVRIPELQIELQDIPANSSVVVDSAKHEISIHTVDPTTGVLTVSNGENLVILPEGKSLQWLEIRDCDDLTCFCIRLAVPCTQGEVSVLLQTQLREG